MNKLLAGLVMGLLSSYTSIAEQDGKALYTMYCGSCHGMNGEGGAGDSAPPLANSPWVKGAPERSIKILLHGLQGELLLNNKLYDLVMPPQGMVLDDSQIAKVLTYVRSSWGNEEQWSSAGVSAKMVAKVRQETAKQEGMYEAVDLEEQHPLAGLPQAPSLIKGLIISTYYNREGAWDTMPDFSTLEPDSVEEEHEGLLSLKDLDPKISFGVLWSGRFEAQHEGEYTFTMLVDDGARLYINDTLIVSQEDQGGLTRPAKVGNISLPVGQHEFRMEYYQAAGQVGLELRVKTPGVMRPVSLHPEKPKGKRKKPKPVVIALAPEGGEAVSFRNFIGGMDKRSIAYGYPEGLNLSYSQDLANVQSMWKGDFIDAGPRWTGRGNKFLINSQESDLNITNGITVKINGSDTPVEHWKIELDERRYPTFYSRVVGHPNVILQDRYDPIADGSGFRRQLQISGEGVTHVTIPVKSTAEGQPTVSCMQQAGAHTTYSLETATAGLSYIFDYKW